MVLKVINATEVRPGTVIMVDNQPFAAKSNDVSKTGKHGASKCRIEAVNIFTGKKKVIAVPGHERFDVPLVEKKKAQVLSVNSDAGTASVMDLESYETLDLPYHEDIKEKITPEKQVDYWDVEGKRVIMKVY